MHPVQLRHQRGEGATPHQPAKVVQLPFDVQALYQVAHARHMQLARKTRRHRLCNGARVLGADGLVHPLQQAIKGFC